MDKVDLTFSFASHDLPLCSDSSYALSMYVGRYLETGISPTSNPDCLSTCLAAISSLGDNAGSLCGCTI